MFEESMTLIGSACTIILCIQKRSEESPAYHDRQLSREQSPTARIEGSATPSVQHQPTSSATDKLGN